VKKQLKVNKIVNLTCRSEKIKLFKYKINDIIYSVLSLNKLMLYVIHLKRLRSQWYVQIRVTEQN
jgi:hypothetical protein